MQQIKVFKGVESEVGRLEAEVNAWIRQTGAKIISVTGNIAPQSPGAAGGKGGLGQGAFPPSDVVLVLLYESASS